MRTSSRYQAIIIGVLSAVAAVTISLAVLALLEQRQRIGSPVAITTVTPGPVTETPAPPTTAPGETPLPTPTLTPTPTPIDYAPLQTAFDETIQAAYDRFAVAFDVGVAFIDLETGQQVLVNGDVPYYSLSTFKAPLVAYYLQLAELGQIERNPADDALIEPMLARSDNPATTCLIRRTDGLAGFNDWLATDLGMLREQNYVIAWDTWACEEDGVPWFPESDLRYIDGDESVGLSPVGGLRPCPTPDVLCDKVFTPAALASFYQRMDAGTLLNAENTGIWLSWMEKSREDSALYEGLPEDADGVRVYVKNGFRAEDEFFDKHFYHEGGIIETPQGSFVLVVFSQGNPDWPGTWLHAALATDAYLAFIQGHTDG